MAREPALEEVRVLVSDGQYLSTITITIHFKKINDYT
jgi:hypothetical protein